MVYWPHFGTTYDGTLYLKVYGPVLEDLFELDLDDSAEVVNKKFTDQILELAKDHDTSLVFETEDCEVFFFFGK